MPKSPLVSIIIPVYNTGKAAKTLIKKILKDKYDNLELLVIDDGSTDDSANILREYKDPRLTIIDKVNGGASSARNLGIKKSHGKFIVFVDSDDDITEDYISSLVSHIDEENVSLAVCGIHYHKLARGADTDDCTDPLPRRRGEDTKTYVLRSLLHDGSLYSVFNKIFRANIIREHHIRFDESLNFAEDTKFVLEYLKKSPGEIISIPEPLYIYNFGTETSTVSSSGLFWENWDKSYRYLASWVGDCPTLEQFFLLRLIRLRWRISWFRNQKRFKNRKHRR